MNKRDDLREQVSDVLRNAMNEAIDEAEYYRVDENADRIIALVRADERRRIREAIESEELVAMFARMLWAQGDKPTTEPSSSYYMAARYNLDAIAKKIGLTEDER